MPNAASGQVFWFPFVETEFSSFQIPGMVIQQQQLTAKFTLITI